MAYCVNVHETVADLGFPRQGSLTSEEDALVHYYRPQRSCGKVIFLQACREFCPQGWGHAWQGGMHGGVHAWQGVCVVGGMHSGGHV